MSDEQTAKPIGFWPLFVLDCADARQLAEFYSAVTGLEIAYLDDDWAQVGRPPGTILAFQRIDEFQAPDWPGGARPIQAHLDFAVRDLDEAEAAVVDLGATRHAHQPGTDFRVFLDPAGHPFCLVRPDPKVWETYQ